jgi:hydroxyacylglutathione hydrolase
MDRVNIIPTMGDNYVYVIDCGGRCAFAVDPGESSGVLGVLEEKQLHLAAILVTHHHIDHIGGIDDLKKRTGCQVIAYDPVRLPFADRIVAGGDDFYIGNILINVISTPGHTLSSVCYLANSADDAGMLFTGDTMFVNGCGRIFEGDAATMRHSMQKLASLPDETEVYCGHDYTVENYEFALTITPDDTELAERLDQVRQTEPKVPSTIGLEKRFNPFLRAGQPEIAAALGMENAHPDAVFAELRRRKDVF